MALQFPKLAEHFSHGMSKKAYDPMLNLFNAQKGLSDSTSKIVLRNVVGNADKQIRNAVGANVPVAPSYVGKSGVIPFAKSMLHASGITDYVPFANSRNWSTGYFNNDTFNQGLAVNRNVAKADFFARLGYPTASTVRHGLETNAATANKATRSVLHSLKPQYRPGSVQESYINTQMNQVPNKTPKMFKQQPTPPVKPVTPEGAATPKYTPILKYASLQQSDLKWIGKLLGE
jgi:hypothetical protein